MRSPSLVILSGEFQPISGSWKPSSRRHMVRLCVGNHRNHRSVGQVLADNHITNSFPRVASVVASLHSDHPLDHALRLVPIQLLIFVLNSVFLPRIFFVWVTQAPTTDTSTMVLGIFDIRAPTEETSKSQRRDKERKKGALMRPKTPVPSHAPSPRRSISPASHPPIHPPCVASLPRQALHLRHNRVLNPCSRFSFRALVLAAQRSPDRPARA